jgi:hypothetical protein
MAGAANIGGNPASRIGYYSGSIKHVHAALFLRCRHHSDEEAEAKIEKRHWPQMNARVSALRRKRRASYL